MAAEHSLKRASQSRTAVSEVSTASAASLAAEREIRARAHHCLGDDDDGHDCHRSDHCIHGDAADRRRSRWTASRTEMTGVDQGCLSGDSLADASLGSGILLRCAAPTAIWSFAMSFSLRGGVTSSVFGRPFLGRPSFVPFDMSPGLQGGAREKCQLMSMCTRWLLSKFGVVGMHSTERRRLCCMRAFALPPRGQRGPTRGGGRCGVFGDFRFPIRLGNQ